MPSLLVRLALTSNPSGVRVADRGCKPEPPKVLSLEIKSGHDGIQVDDLSVVVEGVVPIQQDVAPRRWRNLRDQLYRFGIAGCLLLGQQPRKDRRVASSRDRCSPSPRNSVRNHPGM